MREELASLRCWNLDAGGLVSFVPSLIFFIGYFVFLNRVIKTVIPRRHRITNVYRWCTAVCLTSQAYEIWTKTIRIVNSLLYKYIPAGTQEVFLYGRKIHLNLNPDSMVPLTITVLSILPLLGAFALSGTRELRLSWNRRGQRSELGAWRYYLSRPIVFNDCDVRSPLRVRSAESFRPPSVRGQPLPPRSA